jgi:ribosomal protein S18 acetylase RimI-like enzyme
MDGRLETVRMLEQCMLNAWPSTRAVHCDGWVFRTANGYTRRANSAHALTPSRDFPSVFAKARDFYAAHRQPATFRLTPLAGKGADAHLRRLGFACIDPTIVMSKAICGDVGIDQAVTIGAEYSEDWGRAYAAARGLSPADAAAHAVILRTIALPTAYAMWCVDGMPLAFGLGVLDYGRLGLFDIATEPAARRQGAARKVVSSLLGWGQMRGAHTAWLSVVADNHPAIGLYGSFGFDSRYRYHYRAETGAPSALSQPGFTSGGR